ncbi:MAG TPA: ATP-binding protein [Actinospica sp.]|nr:ATP-binding protein [Actinospica sp.]
MTGIAYIQASSSGAQDGGPGTSDPGAGPPGPAATIIGHLGEGAEYLPVISGSWPPYDHVNVQGGIDRWLESAGGGEHRLLGLTGFRHRMFGLADLCQPDGGQGMRIGGVAMRDFPSGPDGEVRNCVQCGLYLYENKDLRMVLLLRGSDQRGPQPDVTLEIVATDPEAARAMLARVRELAVEHSVYRRQVVSFGEEAFGPAHGGLLSFHPRPRLAREELILPEGLLDGIERQIIGVAHHREALLGLGQHLKRGVLLYGEPGVGKTHTVRYLISSMPELTVLILSGSALRFIREACSVARSLQPSLLVIEDVDLIAEGRGAHPGNSPMLFQLLNEMDGLGDDIDVTFLLTTNRADILEPALASRPGRIDHAAEIPLPDAEGRRRLLSLYQGGLTLDLADPDRVLHRTEGVTASFLKELLRRAALIALEEREGRAVEQLRVTDAHLDAALDVLLGDGSRLTRRLLGGGVASG